ncbi:uncharacterized protein THITE_2109442 [Thermothielavioides terrestris NRRL 8126]|uniref:Uncharacterized protein n=1 Tax=Thermothielavioides terrestris (strain ATCC 38088 / NRRL 8126) TaxID=578455 RepID=G2QVR6_THETT|nr:uncharacterized protein THITE_2109442 [Thermothielavioides terrestris NRRL 8126]AEO63847.1 hypothetical protein THITE_2109442 [Thermothielavioides terrestris NRRL 8126]
MGHSSKFVFPLPSRKARDAPPPLISGPLRTKAQRILGASELSIDPVAIPAWETQSNSGISIAVSETTDGEPGHSPTRDGWASSRGLRPDKRWEQESEIIPPVLDRHAEPGGSTVPDGATDASSLRRRQSSSTITSYYDKSKLPLSISQQTSSSAMAKGLPAKAQALLDIDGDFTDSPAVNKARKKPSMLDLSSLLHMHRSPKHLHPDSYRSPDPGHDLFAMSPSATTVSSAPTPPPVLQRAERGVRKKLTKESLRSNPAPQASPHGPAGRPAVGHQQPNKADLDLDNLYDHYEQRTFADAMERDLRTSAYQLVPPTPPPSCPPPELGQGGRAFLSPVPPGSSRTSLSSKQSPLNMTAAELKSAGIGIPSSPLPADSSSISSRHTRTSKASKRTDRSLQEIDLLQNSVLALSSDSEDDYELSSKGSLAVPPLSDGQVSPTSPRSPISQTSTMGAPDASRGKTAKRTSFAPTSHGSAAVKGPTIGPRTSSLNPKMSTKLGHATAHKTSRLSAGTSSTGRTVSQAQTAGSNLASNAGEALKQADSESQFDFPAPPVYPGRRPSAGSRLSEQSLPVSPSTTAELYWQSYLSPGGPDGGSVRSGTSIGSASNGRRGSAASSIHDGNSGRLMAVTRQEEMLLAALRMKRARMREDIIAEFEDEIEREEQQLRRERTNDSFGTSGSMSRQSSRSTMRQEVGALSARPRHQTQPNGVPATVQGKDKPGPLKVLVERSPYDSLSLRTPASEISDFIHYDDGISSPGPASLQRQDSKASSVSSRKSAPGRQRASLSAMSAPPPPRSQRRDSGSRKGADPLSPKVQPDLPHQIPEDPAEDDDVGIPRPDSPVSPSDFPTPVSIKNKKQVRLSAVGFYKPTMEAGY